MTAGELTGTAGVTILLLAFALNLAGKLNAGSKIYLSLNVLGAGLAGLSSYLIAFWPFVVLESVWAVSSLFALVKSYRNE
jgi:hypothetical protein